MGKVTEKLRLKNIWDPLKSAEVEAVVDTGATMLVLPEDIVRELGLRRIREVRVRYANNQTEPKAIYGVVSVELAGREGNFDVLGEVEGSQPLIGQIILEELDLVVEPKGQKLIPNPESPDMPTLEILGFE